VPNPQVVFLCSEPLCVGTPRHKVMPHPKDSRTTRALLDRIRFCDACVDKLRVGAAAKGLTITTREVANGE
jgi:hypothetical protein